MILHNCVLELLKKAVAIGMMAKMITGCSQEVQTTYVDGLNL